MDGAVVSKRGPDLICQLHALAVGKTGQGFAVQLDHHARLTDAAAQLKFTVGEASELTTSILTSRYRLVGRPAANTCRVDLLKLAQTRY